MLNKLLVHVFVSSLKTFMKNSYETVLFDSRVFRRKIWESLQLVCCHGEPTCIARVSTHQQGNILYCAALCASLQNQNNSSEVRGSGHDETNARASLERGNVPKSLISKGRATTETNYTIVRGTLYAWIGTVWSFGSL